MTEVLRFSSEPDPDYVHTWTEGGAAGGFIGPFPANVVGMRQGSPNTVVVALEGGMVSRAVRNPRTNEYKIPRRWRKPRPA